MLQLPTRHYEGISRGSPIECENLNMVALDCFALRARNDVWKHPWGVTERLVTARALARGSLKKDKVLSHFILLTL